MDALLVLIFFQNSAGVSNVPKGKVTGSKAAASASKTLKSDSTGKSSKTAAGSALSQTKSRKETTSKPAAKSASKVVRDGRTSATSKSAAGSALSQTSRKRKGSKKSPK